MTKTKNRTGIDKQKCPRCKKYKILHPTVYGFESFLCNECSEEVTYSWSMENLCQKVKKE